MGNAADTAPEPGDSVDADLRPTNGSSPVDDRVDADDDQPAARLGSDGLELARLADLTALQSLAIPSLPSIMPTLPKMPTIPKLPPSVDLADRFPSGLSAMMSAVASVVSRPLVTDAMRTALRTTIDTRAILGPALSRSVMLGISRHAHSVSLPSSFMASVSEVIGASRAVQLDPGMLHSLAQSTQLLRGVAASVSAQQSLLAGLQSAMATISVPNRPMVPNAWRNALATLRVSSSLTPAIRALDGMHLGVELRSLLASQPAISEAMRRGIAEATTERARIAFAFPAPFARTLGDLVAGDVALTLSHVAAEPVDAGDDTLLAILLQAWARILEQLPEYVDKKAILPMVVSTIIAYSIFLAQDRSSAADRLEDRRIEAEVGDRTVKALAATERRISELTALLTPRYQLTRPAPLREDASASAAVIVRLAAGQDVIVRGEMGRWLFVDVLAVDGTPIRAGWIARRNLRPVAAPDAPAVR